MEEPARRQTVNPDVRRVLIYRLGSLGDTIIALPSLHLIARAFPNAERRMLTNIPVASRAPAAAAVLGDSGLVHSYEEYPVGTRGPLRLLRLLLRLRRFQPEVVIYLKATNDFRVAKRDQLYLRLTGAKWIVGVPANPAACEVQAAQPDSTFEHESVRLAKTLHVLGDPRLEELSTWDLRLSENEIFHAEECLRGLGCLPFFAVSVGTKVQAKDWGMRNWRALLEMLAQAYPGYGLMLTGAREESEVTEAAAQGWRKVPGAGPDINLCGVLSPRETAAALRRAEVFIGHDSGPMHLAGIMGTPTVAVFAARNKPRTWFPVSALHCVLYHQVDCWGCGLEVCHEQRKKCILSITVQEVLHAVRQLHPAGGSMATVRGISTGPSNFAIGSLHAV